MKTLKELVKQHALEIAPEGKPFTLKSGQKSTYYLDCRNLCLNPEGLHTVVTAFWKKMDKCKFNAYGGPAMGAIPIVGGLTYHYGMMVGKPRNYKAFFVRKEEKEHGKSGLVVGKLEKEDRCILIEDVVTSGQSSIEAIDAIHERGVFIEKVICIVDRLQGGAEAFEQKGVSFEPLLTIEDLGIEKT